MADTASTQLRLTCYVREEEGEWVAGCPSLDVHTQADSKEEAQAALEEAVDLWLDSCLERDTLHTALRELGWHRVPVGTEPHETCDSLEFSRPAVESVLGESFPIALTVPAFIAASIGFDDPHRRGDPVSQTMGRVTPRPLRDTMERAGVGTAEAGLIMGVTGRSVRRYLAGVREIPWSHYEWLRVVTEQHPDYGPLAPRRGGIE